MAEKYQSNKVRCDIFSSGHKDVINLINYFNYRLRTPPESPVKPKQHLFKNVQQNYIKQQEIVASQFIDFTNIFSLDQKSQNNMIKFAEASNLTGDIMDPSKMSYQFLKFTYLVENEKILSKQMFHIDV
jgi:hypothetical protein